MFLESSFSVPHVLMSDTFPTFLNGYGLVDVVCVLDVVRSCIRKLNPIWSGCILQGFFFFLFSANNYLEGRDRPQMLAMAKAGPSQEL